MKYLKHIRYFSINAMFVAFIYAGFVRGIEGAENVALFMAWLTIISSFLAHTDEMKKLLRKQGRSVPAWFDNSFDLIISFVFVWFGAWFTGLFYFIHIISAEVAMSNALKDHEETEDK